MSEPMLSNAIWLNEDMFWASNLRKIHSTLVPITP